MSIIRTTSLYDTLQSEVHAWYCRLPDIQEPEKLAGYLEVLSAQEIERYHQFKFEKDRHSFLVSHALLRYSLSKYADVHASQWQFSSNVHGKPALAFESAVPGLHFNLTHTDGLAACVVARDRRCGIDAENVQRKNKLLAVAQRMFAEEELALLDENDITSQFYTFWTLREAYVKALGTGLAGSSDKFYFEINKDDGSASVQHKEPLPDSSQNWYFRLFELAPDHVLALGYESQQRTGVLLKKVIP